MLFSIILGIGRGECDSSHRCQVREVRKEAEARVG